MTKFIAVRNKMEKREMADRNLQMLKEVKQGVGLATIARKAGLSRERVRQIIKKFGYAGKDFWCRRKRKVHVFRCLYCKEFFFLLGSRGSHCFCSEQCWGGFLHKHGDKDPGPRRKYPSVKRGCKTYVHTWKDGKSVYKHRVVLEEHLGRKLKTTEHVIHKDGDVTNNNVDNLEIMDRKEHSSQVFKRLHKSVKPKLKENSFGHIYVANEDLATLVRNTYAI